MRWLAIWLAVTASAAPGADGLLSDGAWKRNGLAVPRFEIQGTGARNNPLRRKLREAYDGDELFVRFRIRYEAATLDTPPDGNGEFFVLWLDGEEGGDTSTHSSGVPNLGIHVAGGQNRFMVRYGPRREVFGPRLEGDRAFLLVGRLWKSSPAPDRPFDRCDLWVDPQPDEADAPVASARNDAAIARIGWVGFSTGVKTEIDDRITVWDIELSRTWHGILGLPRPARLAERREAPRTVAFVEDVLPILEARCFGCHAGERAKSGVRLDIWDEVLQRTVPYEAAASRLFQMIEQGEMPPEGPRLEAGERRKLRTWIDEGLVWDEQRLPTPVPRTDHWAFAPIRRPRIPVVRNGGWLRTPVDAFVAARHEQRGLAPAPAADAQTLRRRLWLDLLGLPPSPSAGASDEVDFLDRLLANPAYGERWGRHWLDVARWAESNGHQHNRHRPHAWRYRDWVVQALNDDQPYASFVREQLAGDEMVPYGDRQLVATGFLSAARYSGNELDKDLQRNAILVDMANTTARAFLGLTLECAQCHTHKFDPISIRDYYRFLAFFANGQPGNIVFARDDAGQAPSWVAERWRIFDTVHARLVDVKRKQGHPEPIYVIPKSVVSGMRRAERARFDALEQSIARLPQTWGFYAPGHAARPLAVAPHKMRWPLPRDPQRLASRKTRLLLRGDVRSPGPEVRPGWPAVFGPTPELARQPRLALADWMARPDHPLVARVWVNRIWQWHFGRGIVASSSDFGTQGRPPSHPDLLDYLACELIDSGWSTKHIHRLILLSATYRQSSRNSVRHAEIDPDNRYLWRWTPRRLEAEAIRDAVLAVAGQLDRRGGGPSLTEASRVRSLYVRQRRDDLPHQQMLFDSANGIVSCAARRVSTTALQPLWLLNSPFMQRAAEQLAARAGSVERAVELAFGRAATGEETAVLERLTEQEGLASACLAVLNSSEFLYIP